MAVFSPIAPFSATSDQLPGDFTARCSLITVKEGVRSPTYFFYGFCARQQKFIALKPFPNDF
jgi:hypothetical protein